MESILDGDSSLYFQPVTLYILLQYSKIHPDNFPPSLSITAYNAVVTVNYVRTIVVPGGQNSLTFFVRWTGSLVDF